MPQPVAVDRAANILIRAFTDAQRRIEQEQAAIWTDKSARNRLRRLNALGPRFDAELAKLIDNAEDWLDPATPNGLGEIYQIGAKTTAASVNQTFRSTSFDRAAVQSLANDTLDDILANTKHVSDDARRWIQQTTRRLQLQGQIEGLTQQQVAKRLADLAPRAATLQGMPIPISGIQYANGSLHTLDDYADMLIRTRSSVAHNEGLIRTGNRYGITRYEGLDGPGCGLYGHGQGPDVSGTIVTAEIALEYPIAHPRCSRTWIPRPDLDPQSGASDAEINRDVFSFDPSTTEAQRAQARDFVRAKTPTQRAAARNPITPPQPKQAPAAPSSSVGRQRNAAAEAALKETDAAKDEATKVARARASARAARESARKTARTNHGPLLDEYGITPDEFNIAAKRIKTIRAQLRADAGELAGRVRDQMPATELAKPPPLKTVTDIATGRKTRTRGSAEWEWFDELDELEQKALRRDWLTGAKQQPDQLGTLYGDGAKISTDDAVELWLDDVRRVDGAKSIASGRNPQYLDADEVFDGFETALIQELRELGLNVSDIIGDTGGVGSVPRLPANATPEQAEARARQVKELADRARQVKAEQQAISTAKLASAEQDLLVRYADDIFEELTDLPRVYEMTPAQYARELSAYSNNPTVRRVLTEAADGAEFASGTYADTVVKRFAELVPDGLDLHADDIAGTYERLVHIAQRSGRTVTPSG